MIEEPLFASRMDGFISCWRMSVPFYGNERMLPRKQTGLNSLLDAKLALFTTHSEINLHWVDTCHWVAAYVDIIHCENHRGLY